MYSENVLRNLYIGIAAMMAGTSHVDRRTRQSISGERNTTSPLGAETAIATGRASKVCNHGNTHE